MLGAYASQVNRRHPACHPACCPDQGGSVVNIGRFPPFCSLRLFLKNDFVIEL